jgi:putative ABC transport system permease protein
MFIKRLLAGFANLLFKQRAERELDDELRDFFEHSSGDKLRSGVNPGEARRQARLEMGGFESVKEAVRSASWESHIESLFGDLRYGLRLLRLNPVFACAAITSLALGIGANSAVFELVDAVRLRTLPVKNPQELVRVTIDHRHSASGTFSTRYADLTYAMWQEIRARQRGLSKIFAWAPNTLDVSRGGEARYIQGLYVSGEFFETLGVRAAAGRLIGASDDQMPCTSAGAVLSYAFWQREYGGDPKTVGGKISVKSHSLPIIGVSEAGFYGVEVGHSYDIALPLCADAIINSGNSYAEGRLENRSAWWLSVMGRLKPGWTVQRVSNELQSVSREIFEASLPPTFNAQNAKQFVEYKLAALPAGRGLSDVREMYEDPLWILLALAGLVLLIAAANLASLLLARASAREREMAMRMAVGAGRSRLVRQLLLESLLLACIGAGLGAFLARGLSHALVAWLSTEDNPLFVDLRADWRILAFTGALAVFTCILFGLAPALRATRIAPAHALKQTKGAAGKTHFGLRRVLVACQIALSLTLLIGGLLFLRSLDILSSLETGFRRTGILVADIDFSSLHLPPERRVSFVDELLRRVRTVPGVDAAAGAAVVPLSGDGIGHDILPADSDPPGEAPVALFNRVSPDFFKVMGTELLAGRDFDEHDRGGSPNVAIVNETFVKTFARANPLGMRFRVREQQVVKAYEVVGVVRDTKYVDLRESFQPIVYTPSAQNPRPGEDAQILVHSNAPLATLTSAIKNITQDIGTQAEVAFSPFEKTISDGLLRDRLMARLSGMFGTLAVVLAVIGLYGVVSYMVVRRRVEISIRMVLGAEQSGVVGMFLREALLLLAIGLGTGTAVALVAGRAISAMLFGLKPHDPVTYVMAWGLLGLVTLLAAAVPAFRAARLDPMTYLRTE